jgi:acetoin utilization protein AcuB
MLLVENSMTREVVTIEPNTSAADALALCRERRIRHLPVLEEGRLVGIVSDRDLRSAAPALGDPNRAAALEQIRARDVMNQRVVTAHPKEPIEEAAREMYERRIGCLPVMEGEKLVGIVTSSDVMRALVRLFRAHEPGSPIEIETPNRRRALAEVVDVIQDSGVNIVSVLTSPDDDETGKVSLMFRLGTINPNPVVERLKEAGYRVLWPPQREV